MNGRQTQWPRRLGALVYVGLVAAPLLALLGAALSGLSAGRWEWLTLALPQGRRLGLLAQSFGLAAGVTAGGMFVGLLIALQLWQWRSPMASRLRWAFLLLAPLPPAIHALAWSNLAAIFNQFLRHQGLAELPFRGWGASSWVQVMALLPIAIGLALVGLESVDSDLVEAGRLLQPDLRSLARVNLPLAAPALLAGGALLFLLSLVDYAIPSLYQVNVYALEIFADFSANNQAGRALILALPLLAATVAAISLAQSRLRPAALDPSWRQRFPSVAPRWPLWFATLQRLALLVLLVQTLVPLGSLIALTGSWAQFRAALEPAGSEIRFSLGVALLAGLLCLIPAAALARSALRRGRSGWLWWLAMTVPLAVPRPAGRHRADRGLEPAGGSRCVRHLDDAGAGGAGPFYPAGGRHHSGLHAAAQPHVDRGGAAVGNHPLANLAAGPTPLAGPRIAGGGRAGHLPDPGRTGRDLAGGAAGPGHPHLAHL